MKSFAAALAFILAPAIAQAQATFGERDALCYAYHSLTPAQVFALAKPDIKAFLDENEVPAKQRPRVTHCIKGMLSQLVPTVREECLGGDPTGTIEAALTVEVFACLEQSVNPPTAIYPGTPEEPTAPSAARAQKRGLRRR